MEWDLRIVKFGVDILLLIQGHVKIGSVGQQGMSLLWVSSSRVDRGCCGQHQATLTPTKKILYPEPLKFQT